MTLQGKENDALISVQNVADVQESGHFVKRDALRDDATGKGKRKKKRSKKNKATDKKKKRAKKERRNNKAKRSKKQSGNGNGVKKAKKRQSRKGKGNKSQKGKRAKKRKSGKKKSKRKQGKRKSKTRKANKLKIQNRKKKQNSKRKNNAKRKSKRKQLKLLKRLNKMKKNKKSKKQGRKQKQSNDSCQSLDCLNNLVLSLKLEKDTVRNFLAQEKRVKAKINLLKSKQDKKGERWDTAMYLEKRLGETKDHTFLGDGPLCKGVYNSTKGRAASDLAHQLEACNETIEEACKSHSKVNASELAQMEKCRVLIHEYKNESELCQSDPSNCTCWNDLGSKIPGIKDCNKNSGSASKAEKLINADHKNCKKQFIACSKYEDEAIEYMIECYTSETQIKANIKELLVIKDAATKLKTNQEAVVKSSQNKNTAKEAGRHNREKRQKNEV